MGCFARTVSKVRLDTITVKTRFHFRSRGPAEPSLPSCSWDSWEPSWGFSRASFKSRVSACSRLKPSISRLCATNFLFSVELCGLRAGILFWARKKQSGRRKNETTHDFSSESYKFLTVYQNLWHACVTLYVSIYNDETIFSPKGTLIFQPLPPIQCWRSQGKFSKVGKFPTFSKLIITWSRVSPIAHCLDGCFRPCQHWIGGRGCWK